MVARLSRIFALALAGFGLGIATPGAPTVRVPAGIPTTGWGELLRRHVDDRGLVDYAGWRAAPDDLAALDKFIAAYARNDGAAAEGAEEIAALINAYNAFTIRWILANYPTESIRALDGSWSKARWNIGGRTVSLDEIEHQNLRPLVGWKAHATIVCAARSCPPLQRAVYTAGNLEALTVLAYEDWLAREDLNQIDPAAGVVRLSPIFKWFKSDFTGDGEVAKVLEKHGPARHRMFLARREYKTEYLDYHWGLNDKGGRGQTFKAGLWSRLF